jgi:transcriptional regulator with AAA-type ATPase domain
MGKFELANGGILFLDEVGEMPKSLQVKLLRVLQEKEVVRLGGHEKIKLDIKFIYATNKDLKAEVKTGNFREDLYYRVHVFPIQMPALKDRGHDIVLLAEYFLKKMAVELKKPIKGFSLEAEQALLNYDWPGNVRELENVINRAVIVASMERITPADLNLVPLLESAPMNSGVDLQGRAISLDESEKITIQNRDLSLRNILISDISNIAIVEGSAENGKWSRILPEKIIDKILSLDTSYFGMCIIDDDLIAGKISLLEDDKGKILVFAYENGVSVKVDMSLFVVNFISKVFNVINISTYKKIHIK